LGASKEKEGDILAILVAILRNYLHRLSIDIIKIRSSFIKEIAVVNDQ